MSESGCRLLAFGVGVLWLGLAAWVFLFAVCLVGVSIDPGATPIPGWLITSIAMALVVLVAHRWWPAMGISTIAALFLAADVVRSMAGSTPDVVSALTLTAAVAVLIGVASIAATPRVRRSEPRAALAPR